jgi:hypothetical protein
MYACSYGHCVYRAETMPENAALNLARWCQASSPRIRKPGHGNLSQAVLFRLLATCLTPCYDSDSWLGQCTVAGKGRKISQGLPFPAITAGIWDVLMRISNHGVTVR